MIDEQIVCFTLIAVVVVAVMWLSDPRDGGSDE